jgi:hypothetical protein
MLAIIRKIDPMEKDSIIGPMGIIIKANFLMGLGMDKATLKKIKHK